MRRIVALFIPILIVLAGCGQETRASWENAPQFRHCRGMEIPADPQQPGTARIVYPDNKPVLPFRDCKDPDDEKHVHPLQLDVIDRCIALRSNPGETVLTPFMGVGSEVYAAVQAGRKAIGAELKPSYYRQALANLTAASEINEDAHADEPGQQTIGMGA